MKVRAQFIGQNGSLGFISGLEYDIYVLDHPVTKGILVVNADKPPQKCPYAGVLEFFKNWTNIQTF